MPQEHSNIKEKNSSRTKSPGQFDVIFINDDFTPMEFVVLVLMAIFFKTPEEAEMLMLKVHNEGKAIVGTYSYDIAMSKTYKATTAARESGYPLQIVVKPA